MKFLQKNKTKKTLKSLQLKAKLLVIFSALVLLSCEDRLGEEVYSVYYAENFYNDVSTAELGMWGVYDVLGTKDTYGENYTFYMQGSTDESRHWRHDFNEARDLLANYDQKQGNLILSTVWFKFYEGVARANDVIDQVTVLRDKLQTKEFPSKEEQETLDGYNNVLGDTHFLRAFIYFQLTKTWGDVPLRLHNPTSFEDIAIQRAPQLEVYEQIEEDFLTAISLLPEAPFVKNEMRISKSAAKGILARFYLKWAGKPLEDTTKFAKAAEQTNDIIKGGIHSLNTVVAKTGFGGEEFDKPFPQVFKNYSDKVFDYKESMFEIHFKVIGTYNPDGGAIGSLYGVNSKTGSFASRSATRTIPLPTFWESFEEGDLRKDWSIVNFEIQADNTFLDVGNFTSKKLGIGKFRRYLISGVENTVNMNDEEMSWPVLRYADVLLMFAESVNETIIHGGVLPAGVTRSEAYDAVNEIRARAYGSSDENLTVKDYEGFKEQIEQERSWELCFEGVRRNDLIRWGKLIKTVRDTGDLLHAGAEDETYYKFNRNADGIYEIHSEYTPARNIKDHHVLQPIPLTEISQNPLIMITDPTNNGFSN